ncbi:MAG TPA: sialidase family protein [Terriglobales bacterium]|jgi:hypothetical protein|nr:sialidase family protein [Terriglobales bacterium]
MKGPIARRLVVCVSALFMLAGLNLFASYPFYTPDEPDNDPDGVHLAPQPLPPFDPNLKAAPQGQAAFSGDPYVVGPIMTPTTTAPEAETNIAVNPVDPSNFVAQIIDYSLRTGGVLTNGVVKYAQSNDFGATWQDNFVPTSGTYAFTSDNVKWLTERDPAMAIDGSGNVYLSSLYVKLAPGQQSNYGSNSFSSNHPPGGVYVCAAKLPDLTMTNSDCRPVFTYTRLGGNTHDVDRDWIAADASTSQFAGNVYVAWVLYSGCSGSTCASKMIAFSRSTDHGVTWSPAIQINGPQQAAVGWPMVTVGSDGTVYVAYQTFIQSNNLRQHWLAKSKDGGVTFAPAQSMTPLFRDVVFTAPYRRNAAPNLVVSSVPGAEYVYDVFASQQGPGTNINFVRSKLPKGAGGFTPIVKLNDSSAGQREYPAAAVDANGTLHVVWMDTRNSPTVSNYDVYATYSKDLGVTFAPNARVTPALINGDTDFLGDYFGMTVEPATGVAHATWSNGGLAGGLLQTTTLTPP